MVTAVLLLRTCWLFGAVKGIELLAFAQVNSSDPISGGAGWVGAGLLGLVLGWLLFVHLPAKDKQLAALIESKDKQIADLVTSNNRQIGELVASRDAFVRELTHNFRDAMQVAAVAAAVQDKERREDYKASLSTIVNHYEKENGLMTTAIRQELSDLAGLAAALRRVMEQVQKALETNNRRDPKGATG
jgi:hypothetical protein